MEQLLFTPDSWTDTDIFIGTDEEDTQRNQKLRPEKEDKANAYLIAAAPELLEAAIELVLSINADEDEEVFSEKFTRLNNAISKALIKK